ncbi:MAG TPA: hypothetical protein VF062_23980 [Candidatus Limnocylindrales bacterium]
MASEEPVTSPDQHKPTPIRVIRIVSIGIIVLLVAMLFGDNEVNTGAPWILGIAGGIALLLIVDAILRRNGLRD